MSLKRFVLVLFVACVPVVAASSHASPFVQVAANTDYYGAYYDGHYGQILDGYWGRDDKYWYQDGSENWHEDDGTHFQHDPADGFKRVQGSGGPRQH
jgi:hypothetical protein